MAASNQFGTNKQMDPVEDLQSNGANKPHTQRFSRSHKITTRRHPEPETTPSNALVLPTTSKPPFSNGFQHYQSPAMNFPSYSSPQIPNRIETGAQNGRQTWPSVWDPLPKYPLLEQHLNLNNRTPASENWTNSVQNHERMAPNYIHQQNTVQFSQSGALSFQHSLRQNYMMATQTLRTFVNRSQEANFNSADKSPVFEFRESSFSMPPLQPIASLRAEDLKRMAEMSKLANGREKAVRNEAPDDRKELGAPNAVSDSDSDDLVIVEKPKVKCESPITISSDESEDEKIENSDEKMDNSDEKMENSDEKMEISDEKMENLVATCASLPDDSLSDHLDAPARFSPNETLGQSETVSSLDTSNDTESQADVEPSESVIALRFCTVRLNANNFRELVKTREEDVFAVRRMRDGALNEKSVAPCFKRRSRLGNEELVNGGSVETVNSGTKRKWGGQDCPKPRKLCNIFSVSNLLAKPSPRKYTEAVICGKCKCRVADADEHAGPTCCDLTDIYPCLDAKCEKTFICFQRYQAHVEAHGYKVREPETRPPDAEDDEVDEVDELAEPDAPTGGGKCAFCDDSFPRNDILAAHMKQFHRLKSDCEFLEDLDAESLFAKIRDWLAGLTDDAPETCRLCFEAPAMSEMRNHLIEYHSAAKSANLVRVVKVKKSKMDVARFVVPASEADETSSQTAGVIVRKIRMSEPDTTRDKAPPSLKDVQKWLRGLEGSADAMICLFCDKMFLSAFAVYRHLKASHGTCVDKIFGKNLLAELGDVEKSYSVKDGLEFCAGMCEMDRVAAKTRVLLMHFVDADTRKAFEFDSAPVGEVLVRLLYSMNYSYCLFDGDGERDVAFDGLCRNVRTFLLACVAPEVRNVVRFDTTSVEEVLDSLFEFVGVV